MQKVGTVGTTGTLGTRPWPDEFACGNRAVEVLGPLLEEEARIVHEGFWD